MTPSRESQAAPPSAATSENTIPRSVEVICEYFNAPGPERPEFGPQMEARGEVFGEYFNKQAVSLSAQPPLAEAPIEDAGDALARIPPRAPLVRRGQPTVITPELHKQLCLLLAAGFSRRQAAAYLGIDPSTISHAAARDEEFALSLRRAEDISTVQPYMTLLAESQKNWRAAAWLLEHKRKYPPALSEEEKEERLREDLAEAKRRSQLRRARAVLREEERVEADARQDERMRPVREASAKARALADAEELTRRRAERQTSFVLPKRKKPAAKTAGD